MKGTDVASVRIVPQVLTKENYEKWKVVMKNYLRGQGLWVDVVEDANSEDEMDHHASKKMKDAKAFHIFPLWNNNSFSAQNGETELKATPDIEQGLWGVLQGVAEVESEVSWNEKDAKALHIIQLSCGREILDEISNFKTAKEAWNYLSKQYGKDLKASLDTEQAAIFDDSLGENEKLFRLVEIGDDIGNIGMNLENFEPNASGTTLLHVAVIAGNVKNVDQLVKKGKDKLVNTQDNNGYTALALAARYTGNTDIARCMVEKKDGTIREGLLTTQDKEREIPVLLAAAHGHKEMTTYLYSRTPGEVFDGNSKSLYRVLLLTRCIIGEIFDVALKLLIKYYDPALPGEFLSVVFPDPKSLSGDEFLDSPDLLKLKIKKSLCDNLSVLDALAKMPGAFPSGRRFGRLEQFIYDVLIVEKEFEEKYRISNIADLVLSVTRVEDKERQKTSYTRRSGCGFCIQILNFLLIVKFLGGLCCKCLFLPIKLLGRLLRGIAYLFIQIFKRLNIFGIKKTYDRKFIHYEVLGILNFFCQSIASFSHLQLEQASAYEAMLHAAEHGIIEFINAMRNAKPDLLKAVDSCGRDIFSYAIVKRKQNVFQLILRLNRRKEIFRYRAYAFDNNLLHLAAHLGPSSDRDTRSGAALQMQREIQWFKAVEEFVHPKCKEAKNKDGKKPHELFTEHHEELVKVGEKWAKDTATSFTIVGTLITTIMFAAAFTVPGGNDQQTGLPIFLHDNIFTTFIVADAVSLFTSATSVLIFIGILTARYAERDFLKSLPWKLLFGLGFIFLSVCSMIVAFCATIVMILKGYKAYRGFVVGPTLALGSIPIIVLVVSQLRLMHDIFHSTWRNPINSTKK